MKFKFQSRSQLCSNIKSHKSTDSEFLMLSSLILLCYVFCSIALHNKHFFSSPFSIELPNFSFSCWCRLLKSLSWKKTGRKAKIKFRVEVLEFFFRPFHSFIIQCKQTMSCMITIIKFFCETIYVIYVGAGEKLNVLRGLQKKVHTQKQIENNFLSTWANYR